MKRNSSHVTLPKNTSHGNLRKNHSATALARNISHPALKKIGLAPAPKSKTKDKKEGVFQLGDRSSDEEEEAEWEDSATQSPEFTRNNSKTSTPARAGSPSSEEIPPKTLGTMISHPAKTSSPPKPSLKNNNRSAPSLRKDSNISPSQLPPDPALLQQYPRASRAPPAMSTVSAHVPRSQIIRSESSKSFTHISHAEAASMTVTPAPSGSAMGPMPGSSMADGGVSRFLPMTTPSSSLQHMGDGSDEDSPSTFLSNYKPQPSESPEKTKTLHKARLPQNPSRTQQRLELQRREIMRAGAATPTTPPTPGLGLNLGSSTSLHSRTGSRSRNRSLAGGRTLAGELKAVKQDYESAVKQLTVVRRFRGPIVESMIRLKENSILPPEVGVTPSSLPFSKSRPQSRRGLSASTVSGSAKTGVSRSLEDRKSVSSASRPHSGGRGSRVHFQRQSSHDDIGVTPSQGSPSETQEDDQEGLTPEEALLRRIWDSREVYDAGDNVSMR